MGRRRSARAWCWLVMSDDKRGSPSAKPLDLGELQMAQCVFFVCEFWKVSLKFGLPQAPHRHDPGRL